MKTIEETIKEFDDIYIHDNLWKSVDETEVYAPLEGVRQWIYSKIKLHEQIAERLGVHRNSVYWALEGEPELKLAYEYYKTMVENIFI